VREHVYVRGFAEGPPPLLAVRVLVDWLTDGIDRALRLRLEGRSAAQGPRPRWLSASRAVGVERLAAGSIDLALSTPTLGELFGQTPQLQQGALDLFSFRASQTPLEVFREALDDALHERDDAQTLDAGLLDHIATAKALFDLGAEEIVLQGSDRLPDVNLSASALERVRRLADRTPLARRVRVMGRLYDLNVKNGGFEMEVGADALRGALVRQRFDDLAGLLNKLVMAEGDLTYRPSGRPLRFEAHAMREATDRDAHWATLPAPQRARRAPKVASPNGMGLDDLFAGEEGDTDDTELLDLKDDA